MRGRIGWCTCVRMSTWSHTSCVLHLIVHGPSTSTVDARHNEIAASCTPTPEDSLPATLTCHYPLDCSQQARAVIGTMAWQFAHTIRSALLAWDLCKLSVFGNILDDWHVAPVSAAPWVACWTVLGGLTFSCSCRAVGCALSTLAYWNPAQAQTGAGEVGWEASP